MRSVQVPARRLSILALAFVFAVGISACSEPAQEPQPIVLVITATPADTPTPVVIVVTATRFTTHADHGSWVCGQVKGRR